MEALRLTSPGSILVVKDRKNFPTNSLTSNTGSQIYLTNSSAAKISHPCSNVLTNSTAAKFSFPRGNVFSKSRPNNRSMVTKSGNLIGENPEWFESDYIVVGLAHCFSNVDDKLRDYFVIEPIPASGLECMFNGGATSYKYVVGSTLGVVLKEDVNLLPEEFKTGVFGEKFAKRAKAASRTWKREYPQGNLLHLAPIGVVKGGFNFSLEDRRLLGFVHEVKDDDNIKQDLSIDVYGRKKKEDEGEKKDEESLISALYNV